MKVQVKGRGKEVVGSCSRFRSVKEAQNWCLQKYLEGCLQKVVDVNVAQMWYNCVWHIFISSASAL